MIDPHKEKYWPLYWSVAEAAARQSIAERAQVGCCIVTSTGMLATGWNGMPPGFPNQCENRLGGSYNWVTDPRVVHAERNAIDKLTREGVSPKGAHLFVTMSPCLECAKSIHAVGITTVHYRDTYRDTAGLTFLAQAGIKLVQRLADDGSRVDLVGITACPCQ